MASRGNPAEPRRPAPRLYLVTPQDPAGLADKLAQALGAADVAAVLLRLPQTDERTPRQPGEGAGADRARQRRGAYSRWSSRSRRARWRRRRTSHWNRRARSGAGLRSSPRASPAAADSQTRHDAMLAAEAGADYVMFGEPDEDGHRPSFEAIAERVAWWAEVFEIPCVGFAASLDEVEPLAAGRRRLHRGRRLRVRGRARLRGGARRRRAPARGRGDGRMKSVRHIARARLVHRLVASAAAQAPIQPRPARRGAGRAQPRTQAGPEPAAPKPAAPKPAPAPAPAPSRRRRSARRPPQRPRPVAPRREADMAYGAFQRGHYITAFAIATRRVEEQKRRQGHDAARRALRQRPRRRSRRQEGRRMVPARRRPRRSRGDVRARPCSISAGAPARANREQAAKLLAAAAKLGHAAAAYNLGLLYLEGQLFPQDFARAAELFRAAAQPATRKRNTRSPRSTRKAAACRRI